MRKILDFLFGTRKRTATTTATGTAGVLVAAATFIGPWEGLRTDAYLDPIGVPTVCYGETRGVNMGDSYTAEECKDMLSEALVTYRNGLAACFPALADQPEGVQVAFISWTYNVGIGAACKSTLVKLANAGDMKGACNQLPRWNRAGGSVLRGLTNRRASERDVCLGSLE